MGDKVSNGGREPVKREDKGKDMESILEKKTKEQVGFMSLGGKSIVLVGLLTLRFWDREFKKHGFLKLGSRQGCS